MKVQGKHQHSGISTKIRHSKRSNRRPAAIASKRFTYTTVQVNRLDARLVLLDGVPFFKAAIRCGRPEILSLLEKLNQASRPYWVEIANEWITSLKPD